LFSCGIFGPPKSKLPPRFDGGSFPPLPVCVCFLIAPFSLDGFPPVPLPGTRFYPFGLVTTRTFVSLRLTIKPCFFLDFSFPSCPGCRAPFSRKIPIVTPFHLHLSMFVPRHLPPHRYRAWLTLHGNSLRVQFPLPPAKHGSPRIS